MQDYLLDIQPGYDDDPVRGVYNHGWIIGDERAITVDVQARIDTLLEIRPWTRTERLVDSAPWPKPSSPNACVPTTRSRVEDVRQLMGASTPALRAAAPQPHPQADRAAAAGRPGAARGRARDRAARAAGFAGEVRGEPEQPGQRALKSLGEDEPSRYAEGATHG